MTQDDGLDDIEDLTVADIDQDEILGMGGAFKRRMKGRVGSGNKKLDKSVHAIMKERRADRESRRPPLT